MLGLAKCLPPKPLEPISEVCLAALSAHRNPKSQPTDGIRGHVNTHKLLAAKELMFHNPAEFRLAAQSL